VTRPSVSVDLGKIERNARAIVKLCAEHGISVTGVTKCTCGLPEVARAMLRGGVVGIGESRMQNVRRLEAAGVRTAYTMLRVPPLSDVEEIVEHVELSLNSELAVLHSLSAAARARNRIHDVLVMVDLGDLREGVWPDDLVPFVREVLELPGVRLAGLGANLTCYAGVIPTVHNMGRLVRCAEEVEQHFGIRLDVISGGNSSALPLIASGRMPRRVNHARIGEAILLGCETAHRKPWPGTSQDAFVLRAEIVELKHKPSLPIGPRGEDAFGGTPDFEDRGDIDRALLNVGREDVDVEGLTPLDPRLCVLGASGDYLVLDVTAVAGELKVGDEVAFALRYGALLAAMESRYVDAHFVGGPEAG
jgi:predicted amino acid racemase